MARGRAWPRLAELAPPVLRRRFRRQWLAYVPLLFHVIWLMLRFRSITLYTAANPGIVNGGATGESKAAILEKLGRIEGAVADYLVVPANLEASARLRAARQWIERRRVEFPVVLKPDVGERGRAVAVVRDHEELARHLRRMGESAIVQRFVDGVEFGIFYQRMPGAPRGQIVSIAQMIHPTVVGDGRATLGELLRAGPWIAARAAAQGVFDAARLHSVPAAGDRVHLFEIGFYSHDATFADRRDLRTPRLERRIEAISRAHPGFFMGRFDVIAPSADALRQAQFEVIELNGVVSEQTHIYDPATGIARAFGVLRRQWSDAFRIGAANRAQGARPMPASALLRLIWRRFVEHFDDDARLVLHFRRRAAQRPHIHDHAPAGRHSAGRV
jgi:hypothetical protein